MSGFEASIMSICMSTYVLMGAIWFRWIYALTDALEGRCDGKVQHVCSYRGFIGHFGR